MKRTSPSSNNKRPHTPIMVDEVLKGFDGVELKVFYEGTLGAGGHASAILEAHPEIERYIGCDKDPDALEIAEEVLSPWKEKIELVQGNFADLDLQLQERGIEQVNGFFLT
ncbi:MAG: Ribosomal RNA small subunit methyltransferase H [Chlamydiae bacterium]|nr:Ribosomal RNA small subunit methyltransferase H [Chlamydiota bacterium]